MDFPYSKVIGIPVDTRRRFNVYTTSATSYRRLVDVEINKKILLVIGSAPRKKLLRERSRTTARNKKRSY